MKRRKTFRGWAVIKSINGCNWGMQRNLKEWPIVSRIVKTKKEVQHLLDINDYDHSGVNPRDIRKIYK